MLSSLDLPSYLRTQQEIINRELERSVPLGSESLIRSMRYSLLAGGKRIRPIICLTVCAAGGGSVEVAMPTAVALEMLHTATLIHDDLPVMDDDDYRRGQLTNHKVFGEGIALLAGDALLSYSLEYVLLNTEAPADRLLRVMHVLLKAVGVHGAIGGQVIDIQIEDRDDVDLPALESMHAQKTGALLVAAVVSGAVLAGIDEDMIRRISRYGERIGLAFQIVDDILDVTSTLGQLGKTPNKDEKMRKATFPRLLGIEKSRQRALELVDAAKDEVRPLGEGAVPLFAIADYIVARSRLSRAREMTDALNRKLFDAVQMDNLVPRDLAASWYVGLASSQLGGRPVALRLFGRDVVAWRDRSGRPAVAPRYCPHQGASLATGSVVDAGLRCPFHGWKFDSTGACVHIPGSARIPATARLTPFPSVERYGYIWVWYGTPDPLFPLPDFPPLGEHRSRYIGFRYTDRSTGSARQLLENAFDYFHFQTLHGLSLDRTEFRMLRDPTEASDNGGAIDVDAWLGAWFEGVATPGHPLRDPGRWLMAKAATFAAGSAFQLLVDGWPGGQRFTGYVDGKEFFKVLLAIIPVAERVTIQVGWAGTPRTGGSLHTLFNLVMLYGQSRVGTRQDIPIYDTTEAAAGALRTRYDNGVVRFRRYYQAWVDQAEVSPTRTGGLR